MVQDQFWNPVNLQNHILQNGTGEQQIQKILGYQSGIIQVTLFMAVTLIPALQFL